MIVHRTDNDAPIRWKCSVCDDTGLISNWTTSPYDLRRRGLTVADATHNVVIANETAAALRELQLLDPGCERTVFRIRGQQRDALLSATDEDLD